jgi:hypothetical protein
MTWLLVVAIAWTALAVLVALLVGRSIRLGDRMQRPAAGIGVPDSVPGDWPTTQAALQTRHEPDVPLDSGGSVGDGAVLPSPPAAGAPHGRWLRGGAGALAPLEPPKAVRQRLPLPLRRRPSRLLNRDSA